MMKTNLLIKVLFSGLSFLGAASNANAQLDPNGLITIGGPQGRAIAAGNDIEYNHFFLFNNEGNTTMRAWINPVRQDKSKNIFYDIAVFTNNKRAARVYRVNSSGGYDTAGKKGYGLQIFSPSWSDFGQQLIGVQFTQIGKTKLTARTYKQGTTSNPVDERFIYLDNLALSIGQLKRDGMFYFDDHNYEASAEEYDNKAKDYRVPTFNPYQKLKEDGSPTWISKGKTQEGLNEFEREASVYLRENPVIVTHVDRNSYGTITGAYVQTYKPGGYKKNDDVEGLYISFESYVYTYTGTLPNYRTYFDYSNNNREITANDGRAAFKVGNVLHGVLTGLVTRDNELIRSAHCNYLVFKGYAAAGKTFYTRSRDDQNGGKSTKYSEIDVANAYNAWKGTTGNTPQDFMADVKPVPITIKGLHGSTDGWNWKYDACYVQIDNVRHNEVPTSTYPQKLKNIKEGGSYYLIPGKDHGLTLIDKVTGTYNVTDYPSVQLCFDSEGVEGSRQSMASERGYMTVQCIVGCDGTKWEMGWPDDMTPGSKEFTQHTAFSSLLWLNKNATGKLDGEKRTADTRAWVRLSMNKGGWITYSLDQNFAVTNMVPSGVNATENARRFKAAYVVSNVKNTGRTSQDWQNVYVNQSNVRKPNITSPGIDDLIRRHNGKNVVSANEPVLIEAGYTEGYDWAANNNEMPIYAEFIPNDNIEAETKVTVLPTIQNKNQTNVNMMGWKKPGVDVTTGGNDNDFCFYHLAANNPKDLGEGVAFYYGNQTTWGAPWLSPGGLKSTWTSTFLALPEERHPASAGAKGIKILFEDLSERTTTHITLPDSNATTMREEVYTLDGRRAAPNAKGLLIFKRSDGSVRKVLLK